MSRIQENTGFICEWCGAEVLPLNNGSYRNHCPFCLHSKHVDVLPGDRKNQCRGLMQPLTVRHNPKKGWQIVHRCITCGAEQANIIADADVQPDDIGQLTRLSG
ncbi:MAG: RNHCP domain-containing protein [Firmicutes bacterium]|nr:RNHCP domain-containing protein [Bacillota bacterium]